MAPLLKRFTAIACAAVLMTILQFPAYSAQVTFSPFEASSPFGTVDGTGNLRAVGRLHMSEGRVVIKHNQIAVYSDATDKPADAELLGAVVNAHLNDTDPPDTVTGIAVFTGGYSVPALEEPSLTDSIKLKDGTVCQGQIVSATPELVRLKAGSAIRDIQSSSIAEINSSRAFQFSLPLSPQPPQSATNPDALVSFAPTYFIDPAAPPLPRKVKPLQGQLTENHPRRKALMIAAVTMGAIACFAIPTAITVICPRPKNLSN